MQTLLAAQIDHAKESTKFCMLGAAVAMVTAVTTFDKVVADPVRVPLLIGAALFFLFVTACLVGLNQDSSHRFLEWSGEVGERELTKEEDTRWDNWTQRIVRRRSLGWVMLSFGVCSLVLFAGINLYSRDGNSGSKLSTAKPATSVTQSRPGAQPDGTQARQTGHSDRAEKMSKTETHIHNDSLSPPKPT